MSTQFDPKNEAHADVLSRVWSNTFGLTSMEDILAQWKLMGFHFGTGPTVDFKLCGLLGLNNLHYIVHKHIYFQQAIARNVRISNSDLWLIALETARSVGSFRSDIGYNVRFLSISCRHEYSWSCYRQYLSSVDVNYKSRRRYVIVINSDLLRTNILVDLFHCREPLSSAMKTSKLYYILFSDDHYVFEEIYCVLFVLFITKWDKSGATINNFSDIRNLVLNELVLTLASQPKVIIWISLNLII